MLKAVHNNLHFEIVADDPEVGAYLYVYKGGKCIRDDLQNDVKTCKEVAFEDYGVPLIEWADAQDQTNGDHLSDSGTT